MTRIGTKVIVRFPDGQEINGVMRADTADGLAHQVTPIPEDDNGGFMTVPSTWVRQVTPPCPWTFEGTPIVVEYDSGLAWPRVAILLDSGWCEPYGAPLDYATDIAPSNPVRLVPARKPLRHSDGTTFRPLEGTELYTLDDGATRAWIEDHYGPVREVSS